MKEAKNPPAPREVPAATLPVPASAAVRQIEVSERHADLVRHFALWLEYGPDHSSIQVAKRGRSVVADFGLHGSADRVLATVAHWGSAEGT